MTFQSNADNCSTSRHSTPTSCKFTKNKDPYHIVIYADSFCITHLPAISKDPYSLIPRYLIPGHKNAIAATTSRLRVASHALQSRRLQRYKVTSTQPGRVSHPPNPKISAPCTIRRKCSSGLHFLLSPTSQAAKLYVADPEEATTGIQIQIHIYLHTNLSRLHLNASPWDVSQDLATEVLSFEAQ